MSRPIIFLDMDGVCCDFQAAAATACGFPDLKVREWDMAGQMQMTWEDMWRHIDALGEDFWADMPTYSHFSDMYRRLFSQGDLYFLSSPSRSPWCLSGKKKWLAKNTSMGLPFDRFIFTSHKELLAAPGRILIDDYSVNCNKFRLAGGESILFPQPWNSAPPGSFVFPWILPGVH